MTTTSLWLAELPAFQHYMAFCMERERVRVAKEAGAPKPWTADSVMQVAFFCNVFREDDRFTKWFRENLRDTVSNDPELSLQACLFARWFNKAESIQLLLPLLHTRMDGTGFETARLILSRERAKGNKVFSAAYIISSPYGDPKIEWALSSIAKTMGAAPDIMRFRKSLEIFHRRLTLEPGLGSFMAYEVVTDLRHTCVLRDAPDIMTWAAPGPGCARGLGWITHGWKDYYSRGNAEHARKMQDCMLSIRELSDGYPFKQKWEMRDVEHTLCEYDKYRRYLKGSRPKRKYPGAS